MSTLEQQQNARFAALDPLLPPIAAPHAGGEALVTTERGRAGGLLTRVVHEPSSWAALWGAAETWELTAVPGDSGPAGMAALLDAWRTRMRTESPGPDSACVLNWPSRDAEMADVLLAHGFVPQVCLATREPGPPTAASSPVSVRPAELRDLPALVELHLHELRYSSLVGPVRDRPGAAGLLAGEIQRSLNFGGRIWLAEADGVAAGMVRCAWASPTPRTGINGRLPAGNWGYVATMSVAPQARHGGIGQALMTDAHTGLLTPGIRGTFLFYHPANPLSPVFWHRQGYRPLWTTWARQPAWSRV